MLMLTIGLADLMPFCAWRSAPPVAGAASAPLLEFLPDHPQERPVRRSFGVRRLAIDLEIPSPPWRADDVVHDHRRLVAVQVGELEGLVIDQDQDRLLRGKEGVQAGLGGRWTGSPESLRIEIAFFAPWISPVYCSMNIR
jgi:hypothetical protein